MDGDNPNDIGDIGVITSPHPQNFGVKILTPNNTDGARTVKGINLDPQGSGSDSDYSSIKGGRIEAVLEGNLLLQESSTEAGGDITGAFTNTGLSGDIDIDQIVSGGSLTIGGNVQAGATQADGWSCVSGCP